MRESHRIAQRARSVDASGIRKFFDLAARMKDPIDLSIGQPDFDVPEEAKAAAIEAIRGGWNKYTQTQGTAELRQAVADLCRAEFGWGDDRGYLITSGVSGALVLAIMSLVDPGQEVVLPDPCFVMYLHLARLAGAVPVAVDTYPDFRPDAQKFADAVTDRTRLLILNSPANPTGAVYTETELRDIAEIAARRDLLVISDEIYNSFCYDHPFASMASVYENTLLMRGFSKTYGMPGWRLGFCAGPRAIIDKMTMLQQYSFVCAPSVSQAGGLAALRCDTSRHVADYRRKRDMVYEALGPAMGLVRPGGAFYAFAPAPPGPGASRAAGSATAFAKRAIENNVLIIPGSVFSARDTHFRLSYATSDEKLERGLEILAGLAS